jgi:hypothetical protein
MAILAVLSLAGTGTAFAQDAAPGPGVAEIALIPAGTTFFTEGKTTDGPSFGNYDLGAAVAGNFNRFIGVEGEVSGQIGVSQQLGNLLPDTRTPSLLNFSGNVVVNAANGSSVVPYVTGGMGGLTMFEKPSLGVDRTETYLTGNVGGGVKWYAGRWGLRGDYRFIAVQSKDDAPAFFGQEARYGHRVYGAVLLNLPR